ncbi:MAG TPA: hypothetical protein VGC12_02655 [Methyloradius sp.]
MAEYLSKILLADLQQLAMDGPLKPVIPEERLINLHEKGLIKNTRGDIEVTAKGKSLLQGM